MEAHRVPLAERLAAAPAPGERAAVLRTHLDSLFGELQRMSGNREFESMQERLERRLGDSRFCDAVCTAWEMEAPERWELLYRLLAEPFAMFWTYEDAVGGSARK